MFTKMQNEVDSESESEKEVKYSAIMRRKPRNVLDVPVVPKLEVPFSVMDIISRIDQAQLHRAREDINTRLSEIMNNVHRIITRYTADLNLSTVRTLSTTEYKKKQRTSVSEKMITFAQNGEIREKTLAYILAWLEEWSAVLSEMTVIDIDEHHQWITQMQMLPDTLKAIENNVKMLCRFTTSFLEEKKTQKKKILSRGTLWKTWKERVIKRPATAHALRPDQMISDQFATNIKISEIQDMLQELIGTSMFNKLENNAIKYISSTIINLSKALNLLSDELKGIDFQSANMYVDESSDKEKELSLKMIQDLSEENEMLQQKLQDAEEKYEQLQTKVVTERQIHTALPRSSTSKALPGPSSQSSVVVTKAGDIEDNMERIFAKEFGNTVDEAPQKVIKGSGKKWGSAPSYIAQPEMIPGLTEKQQRSPEKKQKKPPEGDVYQKDETYQYQSQKRKYTKGVDANETSRSDLSDNKSEQKVSDAKPHQYSELQALDNKRNERKFFSEAKSKSPTESQSQHYLFTETKSQRGKDGTSSIWEQLRKVKHEYLSVKSPISSTTESMDKGSKSEMSSLVELLRKTQSDYTSEPQKEKRKIKKHQISSETTKSKEEKTKKKETLAFTKKAETPQLVKSHSRIAKETSESTRALESQDDESEQSNLEEFQKAIMAFLKEKIDNIGKPFDKKTVLKEEELLKRAEVEKLGIIKAKMEEYFQKVAETVTKILRRYKDIKKEGQVEEKLMKQKKIVSFMPGLHFQKSPINAKSESSTFPSYDSTDPVINNLLQMILAETESERDVITVSVVGKDHKEKEKQRQEEYLQEGQEKMSGISLIHQLLEKINLSKEIYEKINNNLEEKKAQLQMKEGKQGQQKQKEGQDEVWKKQQKQRVQKQIEQDEKQKQRGKDEEEHQKPVQQQKEAWKQKMKEQGILLEKENGDTRQVQKDMRHLGLKMSGKKEKEKQKPGREVEDLERQRQNLAKDQMKIEEEKPEELVKTVTQAPETSSSKWKRLLEDIPKLYEGKEFHRILRTSEIVPDQKNSIAIIPTTSTQSSPSEAILISGQPLTKCIVLTPQQTQDLGTTLTPQQARDQGITLTPQQAQTQGITLTPQQAQGLGITLTPQQAQDLGITLTPQQAQGLGITLTPQQAQDLGIILTPQQAQTQRITLTPQQAQDLGITLTPQQAQAQGITLTPQQAQAQGITLTPQQAQAQGITLTPQQAQGLGITLTPQQAQAQGITLTPQQAQGLGITLTPQQAQAQGITLTPQQAQDLGITLTPEKPQVFGVKLTHEQAQALRPSLTLEQAMQMPLTTEQAQIFGVPVTQEQAKALGVTLMPEQTQAFRVTFTPQQVQALGPLTSVQGESLGLSLTPEQAQALGVPLTLDKAHTLGSPLTLEQVQPLGELKPSLPTGQSVTSRLSPSLRQSPASSVPITEEFSTFGISSTPLQISRPPLTQGPFAPGKPPEMGILPDPEKLLEPQTLPFSKQTLIYRGPSTSRQFLAPEAPPTPGQLPISGAPPTPGQPLVSGIPPTSGQIPSLGAPLSPGQPLVPGISSIPEQLLESEPITFSEWPQAFQPPATTEQSPYLQAPSTLTQYLAPRTLPGQAPPLWIPSISRYPHPPLAPQTPGKPQKGLSSSVAKRRLAIISSLKSKPALVQPSAPDFKVPQVSLTTKKVQMSEVSDTYEETQAHQGTFAIESLRTFQSYLTNYRTPVSQTPYMKPITSLSSLTTQLLKTSQISPSERDQRSQFPRTKKPKMMVPPSSPQGLEEKRYFVDVEAQRKNLILLNQATKTSGLPSQLYTTARNLIIETLHMDTVRLGYLFRKYIAYRLIQSASSQQPQTPGLKRSCCLSLPKMYELNLRKPIPLIIEKMQISASTKPVQQPLPDLLIEDERKSDMFKKFRQQEDQMEAIWNVDVSVSSYPIEEKTSMHSLWAQLGGYPDIPRLLQLDIQSTFIKSLASIQSQ
uniref:Family with sequence similarity 186 member A n=1 Tax=Propithecus coquereli TaxID=379532 RepID=A0A2K6FQI4_PROCO